jgi:hypothetical protein
MTNPYAAIYQGQQDNPYDRIYRQPSQTDVYRNIYEAPNEEDDPNALPWPTKLGNYGRYLLKTLPQLSRISSPQTSLGDRGFLAAAKLTGQDIAKGLGGFAYDFFVDEHLMLKRVTEQARTARSDANNLITAIKQEYAQKGKIGGTASVVSGLASTLINTPIEAMTGHKNVGGQAVPLTAREQADAIKFTAGLASDFMTQRYVATVLTKGLSTSSKVGALYKTSAANIIGGAAGGVTGGLVEAVGNEDMLSVIATNVIASTALGGTLGTTFDYLSYVKKAAKAATIIPTETHATASALYGNNAVLMDINDNAASALTKVEAFGTTENLLDMAIKANLVTKDGLIVEGLSPEYIKAFESENVRFNVAANTERGVNLIYPKDSTIDPTSLDLFNKTGYLPDEPVLFQGTTYRVEGVRKDGRLTIKASDGSLKHRMPNELQRFADADLRTHTVPFGDITGESVKLRARLTNDTFIDKVYGEFAKIYDLKSSYPQMSYEQAVGRALQIADIDKQHIPHFADVFQRRLRKDIEALTKASDPDEVFRVNAISKAVNDYNFNLSNDSVVRATSIINNNGMKLTVDGGGIYKLSFNDGKPIGTVSSIAEAEQLVRQTRQTKFLDLDGGNTAAIPGSIANRGGLLSDFEFSPSKTEAWSAQLLARGRDTRLGRHLSPVLNLVAARDTRVGYKGKLLGAFETANKAKNKLSYYINTKMSRTAKLVSDAGNIARTLTNEQVEQVATAAEAYSVRELRAMMDDSQVEFTEKLVKVANTDNVRQLLAEHKSENNWDEAVANVKLSNPALTQQEIAFARLIKQAYSRTDPAKFNPTLIFMLADRLRNVGADVSRVDYINRSNFSKEQLKLLTTLDEAYDDMAAAWNDPSAATLVRRLPMMRLADEIGYGYGEMAGEAVKELKDIGIINPKVAFIDPPDIAYRYARRGAGIHSGMEADLASAHETVKAITKQDSGIKGLTQQEFEEHNGAFGLWKLYRDELARGISSAEDKAFSASKRYGNKLFGSASDYAYDAVNASLQGGLLLSLAARDLGTGLLFAFANLKEATFSKALLKVFTGVSKRDLDDLHRAGILQSDQIAQLWDPGAGDQAFRQNVVQKTADVLFRATGQPLVHRRLTAATFFAKRDEVLSVLDDVRHNRIDKAKGYSKIDLDSQSVAFQQYFEDLVKAGHEMDAANAYGRLMSRKIVNFFGRANNPLTWRSSMGRLVGSYGSWGANATSTVMEMLMQGPLHKRAWKTTKFSVASSAMLWAGASVGVDFANMVYNPFQAFVRGGPMIGFLNQLSAAGANAFSFDEMRRERSLKELESLLPAYGEDATYFTRVYLPLSRQLNATINGMRSLDEGANWLQGVWQMGGGNIIEDY